MADTFPLPSLWVSKLFSGFLEETAFRRIQRQGEMRLAVVEAIGGWRADRALAGTVLEVRESKLHIIRAPFPFSG